MLGRRRRGTGTVAGRSRCGASGPVRWAGASGARPAGRLVPGPPDGWWTPEPPGRSRRPASHAAAGAGAVVREPVPATGFRAAAGTGGACLPGWVAGHRSAGPGRRRTTACPAPQPSERPHGRGHPRPTDVRPAPSAPSTPAAPGDRPGTAAERATPPAEPPLSHGRTTGTLGTLGVQPASGVPEDEPATRAPARYRISAGGCPGGPCRWSRGGCARPPGASRRRGRPPCAVRAPRAAARAAGRPAGR